MQKHFPVAAVLGGIVVGAVLFNSQDAKAVLGIGDTVTDPGLYGVVADVQAAVVKVIGDMQTALVNKFTNIGNLLDDKLTAGFTQTANYAKAQIGAQQQITDASNIATTQVRRAFRNAEIRDEHTANPQFCNAADNSQTPIVASIAAENVAGSIQVVADRRGEAVAGTPAYYGQAQAVQAINRLHYARYCSETEAQAGLCTQGALANADQHAANLFGAGTYAGQDGVNTANDFKTNLLQPIVPAALRADQMASLSGQDALPRRRSYNARMSLAGSVVSYVIAVQSPSVPLTAQQQQQQRAEGLPPQATGSWLTATSLEVNRRMSDAGWHASLQAMPPASVQREIAVQLALSNYLAMQNYRIGLYQASLSAALVAQAEEANFREAVQMPSPNMAGN